MRLVIGPADHLVYLLGLRFGEPRLTGTSEIEQKLGPRDCAAKWKRRQFGRPAHEELGDGGPSGIALCFDLGQSTLKQADVRAEERKVVLFKGFFHLPQRAKVPPQSPAIRTGAELADDPQSASHLAQLPREVPMPTKYMCIKIQGLGRFPCIECMGNRFLH